MLVFVLGLICTISSAVAQTILLDFSYEPGNVSGTPDVNGVYWNNLQTQDISEGETIIDSAVTSSNGATTIDLTISLQDTFGLSEMSATDAGAGFNPLPSPHGITYPNSAVRDHMLVNSPSTAPNVFTFSGLIPNGKYDFSAFGYRFQTFSGNTVYFNSGSTSGSYDSGASDGGFMTLANLTADGSGNLSITFHDDNDSPRSGAISALQLTAVAGELRVVDARFNGAAFELEVTGLETGGSYVLKRSENLGDGFPTLIGSPVMPASVTHVFSDPAASGTTGFYRVEDAP